MSTFSELIDFTRSSTGTYLGSDGLIKTANVDEPRLEYDASGQPLGLLIEEQRTNEVRYSNSLSGSAWSGTNCTITTDSTTSPDGNINASKLTCSGGSASVWQFPMPSGLSGNYSNSIYLKADTLNYAQLNVGYLTTDFVANFDLVNGTVTHILGTGATITDVGNGWYRCTLPFNTLGSGGFSVTPIDSMSSTRRSGAVGSVFVYGAQLEQGAFPTSYIPTSGSTVTRNKDVCDTPVERFSYSNAKGSIVVYAQSNKDATSVYAFELAVDSSDRMFSKLQNQEHLRVRVNFADTANINAGNIETGSFAKLGARFANNDFAVSIDGNTSVTDTNGDVNLNCSELKIGQSFSNNEHINGHIKRIQYFPKRLSNDELVELTKPSSSPTMSLTFDGQATSELVEGLHD